MRLTFSTWRFWITVSDAFSALRKLSRSSSSFRPEPMPIEEIAMSNTPVMSYFVAVLSRAKPMSMGCFNACLVLCLDADGIALQLHDHFGDLDDGVRGDRAQHFAGAVVHDGHDQALGFVVHVEADAGGPGLQGAVYLLQGVFQRVDHAGRGFAPLGPALLKLRVGTAFL